MNPGYCKVCEGPRRFVQLREITPIFSYEKVAQNGEKSLACYFRGVTLSAAMNTTRLLSALLIGSFLLVASAVDSLAQRRPSQNTVVITAPPPPEETPDISPK